MKKLFILTIFLSIQSIWAMDNLTDELDVAWGKLKKQFLREIFVLLNPFIIGMLF